MITTRHLLGLSAVVMTATLPGCANEVTVPVVQDPVIPGRAFTSMEIGPHSFSMAPVTGLNSVRLEVRARDQYGAKMTVGPEAGSFSISSSNPGVADVGGVQFWISSFNDVPQDSWVSAYVTALVPGTAVITASWTIGGVTRTAKTTIGVESTEKWSLKVDPASLTLSLGSTTQVRTMVIDAAGKTRLQNAAALTADRDDVVGLSYDEACLDWYPCPGVDVRGVAIGEATLTARYQGLAASISVTVVP